MICFKTENTFLLMLSVTIGTPLTTGIVAFMLGQFSAQGIVVFC